MFKYAAGALIALALMASGAQAAQVTKVQRKAAIDQCVGRSTFFSLGQKVELAGYMHVPRASVPQVLCQRLVDAVIAGRLTPKDLAKLNTGGGGRIWQVLKGRI